MSWPSWILNSIKWVDHPGYRQAFVMGLVSSLGFAPVFFLPLLWFGLWWWYRHAATAPRVRTALKMGWWFGWGHFAGGLYWIARALWVDIERFWMLVPVAVLGIPFVLAIFPSLAAGLSVSWRRYWSPLGLAAVPIIGGIWVLFELLRGFIFPLFPWNLIGYAFGGHLTFLQSASLFGIYGLSWGHFLVLACLEGAWRWRKSPRFDRFVASVCAALVVGAVGHGIWRVQTTPIDFVEPAVKLRLVQANISQVNKWNPSRLWVNLETHITCSSGGPVHCVIWPETAVPAIFLRNPNYRDLLRLVVPACGHLILGVPYKDEQGVYNSLVGLAPDGEVHAVYHKNRLVPFGEYVPFRWLWNKMGLRVRKLASGMVDFTPGAGAQVVKLGQLPPFQPLICYEAIFPEFRVSMAEPVQPQWLLNLTNDGWYGKTAGPYQHFLAARVRAIEQGLPLVRVANTGITVVTDGVGRIVAEQPLMMEGVIECMLPKALGGTLYRQYGEWVLVIIFLGFLLVILSGFYYQLSRK